MPVALLAVLRCSVIKSLQICVNCGLYQFSKKCNQPDEITYTQLIAIFDFMHYICSDVRSYFTLLLSETLRERECLRRTRRAAPYAPTMSCIWHKRKPLSVQQVLIPIFSKVIVWWRTIYQIIKRLVFLSSLKQQNADWFIYLPTLLSFQRLKTAVLKLRNTCDERSLKLLIL